MKDVLRKEDYFVARIKHSVAKSFICRFHYSKGAPKTSCVCFGLFRKDKKRLIGACIYMTAPFAVANKFNPSNITAVLTLSRLAIKPKNPTNSASFLIGYSIRFIKKMKRWTHLVTYADERMGHKGTIYKATNWIYDGKTEAKYAWLDQKGKTISAYRYETIPNPVMDKMYKRIGPFQKHRFYLKIG